MTFGIASVASITVICYLVGVIIKVTPLNDKFIPSIVGVVGLILGIVAFYIKVPDFPAVDVLTAASVGIVSGLASTGANQLYKQLKKLGVADEAKKEETPTEEATDDTIEQVSE